MPGRREMSDRDSVNISADFSLIGGQVHMHTIAIQRLESMGYSYITAVYRSARHEWLKVVIYHHVVLPLFLPHRPQFRVYCSRYRAVIQAICCKRQRRPVSVISATVSLSSVIVLTDTFMPG